MMVLKVSIGSPMRFSPANAKTVPLGPSRPAMPAAWTYAHVNRTTGDGFLGEVRTMADEIKVTVCRYPDRANLVLRYVDPLTGKQKTKSAGTADEAAAIGKAAVGKTS